VSGLLRGSCAEYSQDWFHPHRFIISCPDSHEHLQIWYPPLSVRLASQNWRYPLSSGNMLVAHSLSPSLARIE
jgi:hypothetical protein